ncbi:hypothetical protein HPP92_018203 [Vanilla planifolia]|uniref:Leucine-rich repeat-containing N-terminal plant-type domain-containing protein n=1 Tax=Vanilla planifolia TaxID=51239 RepID=A0A835Q9D3_VANPL|nr:hypothetical protein HPP92_018203 [Vanilla planifolia]
MPQLLLWFLFITFLTGAAVAAPGDEVSILLEFKNSLQVPSASSAVFQSWSTAVASPCNFTGVVCDSGNSVASIELSRLGIYGSIRFSSLCRLPSLSKLSLGANKLSGELTADLLKCSRLLHLDLASNSFFGEVPNLSLLTSLRVLNLSKNDFSGNFPWSSLANLTNLQSLSLGDNSFDPSPFPLEVTMLTNLYWLYLSDCNLHGNIPQEIGNLTGLVNLEFSDNFLIGEIPQEITKLNKLWQLEFYNNSITGSLPWVPEFVESRLLRR